MISFQKGKPGLDKDQRLLTLHHFTPPIILYAQLKVYKLPLKIKLWALLKGWPWTEEPSGLQSMGSQRVRHD